MLAGTIPVPPELIDELDLTVADDVVRALVGRGPALHAPQEESIQLDADVVELLVEVGPTSQEAAKSWVKSVRHGGILATRSGSGIEAMVPSAAMRQGDDGVAP